MVLCCSLEYLFCFAKHLILPVLILSVSVSFQLYFVFAPSLFFPLTHPTLIIFVLCCLLTSSLHLKGGRILIWSANAELHKLFQESICTLYWRVQRLKSYDRLRETSYIHTFSIVKTPLTSITLCLTLCNVKNKKKYRPKACKYVHDFRFFHSDHWNKNAEIT